MIGLFLGPIWKKTTHVGLSDKTIGFVIVWLCDILLSKGDWGSFIRNNPLEFQYGH